MSHEVSVDLLAEDRFAPVVDAFTKTLDETDRSGAALSVWLDGQPVIEARGGTADARTGQAWQPDSLAVVFSCTKGLLRSPWTSARVRSTELTGCPVAEIGQNLPRTARAASQ